MGCQMFYNSLAHTSSMPNVLNAFIFSDGHIVQSINQHITELNHDLI